VYAKTVLFGNTKPSRLEATGLKRADSPQVKEKDMATLKYEVQDLAAGGWKEYGEGELALLPGGLAGLSILLENAGGRVVNYQAYFNGKWSGEKSQPEKIGDGNNAFLAVRILLSFRNGRHIKYRVIDQNFNAFDGMDDQIAGNPSAAGLPLKAILIDYV
jgi:hypothetical protein